jgi:hypothetical protein
MHELYMASSSGLIFAVIEVSSVYGMGAFHGNVPHVGNIGEQVTAR